MNYLAHLFLSSESAEAIVGSLLGDFVKGALAGRYNEAIRRSIELHRKIDSFTDAHAIVRQSKGRISPVRRRFAGIIIDIGYDHFLAKNWTDYSPQPLAVFSAQVADALSANRDILPDGLQKALPNMIANDWPGSYREIHVIDLVLNRMAKRLKHTNPLPNSVEELLAHYDDLEEDFRTFFPDLIHFVETQKRVERKAV